MKISEYTKATSFDDGDYLIKDGTNGTKIIKASDAAVAFLDSFVDSSMHANVYRGKNLGTSVSTAQKTAIQNGTFKDLFVGDYWVIDGVTWRIADMDYFYNCGDTNFSKHHLVIVPDTNLYTAQMNETNVTTGGYTDSKMYTANLETAKTKITGAFGDLVLTHRDYFTNAVTNGYPSGGAWFDSTVELMNEVMVYGCFIRSPMGNGSTIPAIYTTAKKQFSLFRLNPKKLNIRSYFWLRDVVSSASFAGVDSLGCATYGYANVTLGVRPYFVIG